MAAWYYYDNDGQIQGPVSGASGGQLEKLARQGIITPETMIVTDGGKDIPPQQYSMLPLHVAVDELNIEFVKILVSQGADVDGKDKHDSTPLHRAVTLPKGLEIVEFLVSQGANVNATDKFGETILMRAALNSSINVIKFLVSKGAGKDVNVKDKGGYTPLHGAAKYGYVEIAKYLVSLGADVNAQDKGDGDSPLHALQSQYFNHENLEMAKYLVSQGANVNLQNRKGRTPLHLAAALKEKIEVAKFLVSAGTDISVQDKYGKTPLDIAEKKNRALVKYLFGK